MGPGPRPTQHKPTPILFLKQNSAHPHLCSKTSKTSCPPSQSQLLLCLRGFCGCHGPKDLARPNPGSSQRGRPPLVHVVGLACGRKDNGPEPGEGRTSPVSRTACPRRSEERPGKSRRWEGGVPMQVALLCGSEAQAQGTSSWNISLTVRVPGILALRKPMHAKFFLAKYLATKVFRRELARERSSCV